MDLDCDLVIPCRDEAAALPGVLARVPAGMRVVVVDNGSTDGTADVARALGATVVHEAQARVRGRGPRRDGGGHRALRRRPRR